MDDLQVLSKAGRPEGDGLANLWNEALLTTSFDDLKRISSAIAETEGGVRFLFERALDGARKERSSGRGIVDPSRAIQLLAEIPERAHPILMSGLKSNDFVERLVSAEILGSKGYRPAILELIGVVESSNDAWALKRASLSGAMSLVVLAGEAGKDGYGVSPAVILGRNKGKSIADYREELVSSMREYLARLRFGEDGFAGSRGGR